MDDTSEISSFQGQMAARYKERLSMGFAFNKPGSEKDTERGTMPKETDKSKSPPHDDKMEMLLKDKEPYMDHDRHVKHPHRHGNEFHYRDNEASGDQEPFRQRDAVMKGNANELLATFNKLERSSSSASLFQKQEDNRNTWRRVKPTDDYTDPHVLTSSSSCIETQQQKIKAAASKDFGRSFSPNKGLDKHQEGPTRRVDQTAQGIGELFLPFACKTNDDKVSSASPRIQRDDSIVSKNSIETEFNNFKKDRPDTTLSSTKSSPELPQEPLRINLKDYVKRRKDKREENKYQVHKKNWGMQLQTQKDQKYQGEKVTRPSSRFGAETGPSFPHQVPSFQTQLRNEKRSWSRQSQPDKDLQEKLKLEEKRGTAMERYLQFLNRSTPPMQDASIEAMRRIEKLENLRNASVRDQHRMKKYNIESTNDLPRQESVLPKDLEADSHGDERAQFKKTYPQAKDTNNTVPPRPLSRGLLRQQRLEDSKNMTKTSNKDVSNLMASKDVSNVSGSQFGKPRETEVPEKAPRGLQNKYGPVIRAGVAQAACAALKNQATLDNHVSKKSAGDALHKRRFEFLHDLRYENRSISPQNKPENDKRPELRSRSSPARPRLSSSELEEIRKLSADSIKRRSPAKIQTDVEGGLLTPNELADTDLMPWPLRHARERTPEVIKKRGRSSSLSSDESVDGGEFTLRRHKRQKDLVDIMKRQKDLLLQQTDRQLQDPQGDSMSDIQGELNTQTLHQRVEGTREEVIPKGREVVRYESHAKPDATTQGTKSDREHIISKITDTFLSDHRQKHQDKNTFRDNSASDRKHGGDVYYDLSKPRTTEKVTLSTCQEFDRRRECGDIDYDEDKGRYKASQRQVEKDAAQTRAQGQIAASSPSPAIAKVKKGTEVEPAQEAATQGVSTISCHFGNVEDKTEIVEVTKSTVGTNSHSPTKKKRKAEKGKLIKKKKKKRKETPTEELHKSEKTTKEKKATKQKEKSKEKAEKLSQKPTTIQLFERQRLPEKKASLISYQNKRQYAVRSSNSPPVIQLALSPHRKLSEKTSFSPKNIADEVSVHQRSPLASKSRNPRFRLSSPDKISASPFKRPPRTEIPKLNPVRRLSYMPTEDFPIKSRIPLLTDNNFQPVRKSDILVKYRRWRESLMDPEHPSRLPMSQAFKDTLDCAVVEEWALHCWQPERDLYMDETGTLWSFASEREKPPLNNQTLLEPASLLSKDGLLDLGVRLPHMKWGPLRVVHATWLAVVGICALIGKVGERLYKCNGDEFDYFCAEGDLACLVQHINYPI